MEQSIKEHEKVIQLIKEKNKQGFADAIEENILNGFRSLAVRFLDE